MRRNKCKDGHVGPGSKEYQDNYNKIDWGKEVEIKEFKEKPRNKIIIYPREFNLLVKLGAIESDYLINCDISQEKDDLLKRIEELEKEAKILKEMWKELYQSNDQQTWLYEMHATVDSYIQKENKND